MNRDHKIEVNELSSEQKTSMKSRVIVALIMCAFSIPCLFLGGWFFFFIVMAVLCLAIFEILRVPQKKYSIFICVFTYVLILFFVYWIFVKNNIQAYIASSDDYYTYFAKIWPNGIFSIGFSDIIVSSIGIAVAACAFFFVSFLVEEFTLYDVCYLFTMSILIGLGFQSFYFLRYYPLFLFDQFQVDISTPLFQYLHSAFLLIFVLIGTICNDVGAYFTGILFGRNKVNPRISPKKTWEGIIGGAVFSVSFSSAFALIAASLNYPILPTLGLDNWYWIVFLSMVIALLSNLGDFSFSAIKRFFHVKDYGNVLKAHGGVLDRFDSLIFSSLAVSVCVIFITNGWDFFVR